jgi:ubiquitin carboxyl-terminal hydrolase 48
LQDATRHAELRELPHVLHFSLMRFVYDLKTMERKKSKHSISFPLTLNMTQFLGPKEDRECVASRNGEKNLYDLRGILLHAVNS